MIQEHFIVELDHMDAKTADSTLSILEAHHYSGVISAHSWDSPQENPRIYNLGGFVTPIAGASPQSFIAQWRASRLIRNKRFYNGTGFGYGADMNGLAEQSQPTSGSPISYPFTSYDGKVSFTRETWGQRVFDLNKDGVANYGMYPDWLAGAAGARRQADPRPTCSAGPRPTWRCGSGPTACRRSTACPRPRCSGSAKGRRSSRSCTRPGSRSSRAGRAYTYCLVHGGRLSVRFNRRGRVSGFAVGVS